MDSHTFGAELRRRRAEAGYTLRSFAPLVHVTFGQLGKIETGDRRPTPELAAEADSLLNAGGELVTLAAQERAARVRRSVSLDTHGKEAEELRRRTVLNAATTLAVSVAGLAGVDIDPTVRRRIGARDVAALEATLTRMWSLDHERGAGDLWDIAVARAHSVSLMLDLHDYDEPTGQRLLAVAGEAYVAAGWFAQDASRDDVARTCYNEALSLARQAGDELLGAHVLANLALQALFLGQSRSALRFVDAAENALPGDAPTRQASVLKMRRGRALAQLGDPSAASRELTSARRMLDRERGDAPERLAYFTEAEVNANAATSALELGQPRTAARLLHQALDEYDPRFSRNRTLYQVRLAGARAASGELDGAAESLSDALDNLDGRIASRHVAAELSQVVSHHLTTSTRSPAVAGVLDRCAAMNLS